MNQQPVSTIDLIILGCLLGKPMSAYDLARLIEKKHASKLVKISAPAIYKSCIRLFAGGFLARKTTKATEQPEKTIYSLNKKGRERFLALMAHFSSNIEPFFLNCNAFLYHIEKLDKHDSLKMLQNLRDELSKLKTWVVQHEKEESRNLSFASKAIVKQYRMIITTLCVWCDEVVREYKQLKVTNK